VKRASLVLLALSAAAPAARAQTEAGWGLSDPLVTDQRQKYQSPQHFAFELKFGPYSPNIDSTPGLTGHPFSDLFVAQDSPNVGQRPPGRLLTSVEFDWQIWRGFGSIGLGASVGISYRSTHSFEFVMTTDPMTGQTVSTSCQVPNCVRSGDTNSLAVMPFELMAVYRFDVLANRYNVPLVPYFKGGIGYFLWWMQAGSGNLSTALVPNPDGSQNKAIGGTFGLVLEPGIALQLDILDRPAARELDSSLGINHTYVFFEMNYDWVTGFGSSSKLVLSDLTWNAGLAFEF
jgi:hypothetical protein